MGFSVQFSLRFVWSSSPSISIVCPPSQPLFARQYKNRYRGHSQENIFSVFNKYLFQFLTNICFSFKQIIIYLLNTKTVKQRPILISCFSFKRQAVSLPVFVDFWQIFVSVLSKYLFTHKCKNHYSFQAYFSHIFFAFIFIVFSWMSAKLFILIQRYSTAAEEAPTLQNG